MEDPDVYMIWLQALWQVSVRSSWPGRAGPYPWPLGSSSGQTSELSSGRGMYNNWSRWPGLRIAGSIISGSSNNEDILLTTQTIHLCQYLGNNSVWVSSRVLTSTTPGLTFASDSPNHMVSNSRPLIEVGLPGTHWQSPWLARSYQSQGYHRTEHHSHVFLLLLATSPNHLLTLCSGCGFLYIKVSRITYFNHGITNLDLCSPVTYKIVGDILKFTNRWRWHNLCVGT